MEELTLKKKLQVINLFFCGQAFEPIAVKAGISKASVSNIVAELKAGSFPETGDLTEQLEVLRELTVDLAKLKKTPVQALVGIAVLNRMNELNLDPSDMERWPLILHSIKSQDDASQLIEAAYLVKELQQKTGLNIPALEEKVKHLAMQESELEETNNKILLANEQLQGLSAKVNEHSHKVIDLEEKLNWLTPRVSELHQREKTLLESTKQIMTEAQEARKTIDIFNSEAKKLEKAGLSIDTLPDFEKKLSVMAKHHGIKPAALKTRLLQELIFLNKGLSLESQVKAQRLELSEIGQAIRQSRSKQVTLEKVVADLVQKRQNIENTIHALTTSVISEISKLKPELQDTSLQIAASLKNGCAEALGEVQKLKEASISVGQDVGRYEGILEQSIWIKKLMAVMEGREDISLREVMPLILAINQGFYTWFKVNKDKIPGMLMLDIKINAYIQELENWKIT